MKVYDYPCDQCRYKTSSKKRLHVHKRNVHENINYDCKDCKDKFTSRKVLQRHKIEAHNEGGHQYHYCDQCDYQTRFKSTFNSHKLKHSGDIFKCAECAYESKQNNSLKTHVNFVHKGGGFKCHICGVAKSRHIYLREHIEKKHKVKST